MAKIFAAGCSFLYSIDLYAVMCLSEIDWMDGMKRM